MGAKRLGEAVLEAIVRVESRGEHPPAIDGPRYTFTSPLFGTVDLIPHDPATPPLEPVALLYVATEPDNLALALWADGAWHTRGMRPLGKPVLVWFHMEGGKDE